VAVADDASAVFWNPAGLAALTSPELTAMHVFWLEDVFFDHLGAAFPFASGTAGCSLVYLNHGILLRSEAGDTPDSPGRGIFSAADFSFTGAYGVHVSEAMSLGAGLKFFTESIDSRDSTGFAFDLSFLYRLPWPGLTLGVNIQNLGPATRVVDQYFRLPINFKIGAAYRPLPSLLLALDYNQLLEQNGKIALGVEYVYDLLSLRAGYRYQGAIDNSEYYEGFGSNALSGVSAGLGVRYLDFRLDYAFVPYGFLGSTHRIAITYAPPPAAQPAPAATVPAP